jgi:pyrroline-5-carboxylate reductase
MPKGVKSYSKLTLEQISALQKTLEEEKAKREKMSASNPAIASIITSINKVGNELGLSVEDLLTTIAKAVVGPGAYVAQRRGRKPRDPTAPKKTRRRVGKK